jgi:hypothetical protein
MRTDLELSFGLPHERWARHVLVLARLERFGADVA